MWMTLATLKCCLLLPTFPLAGTSAPQGDIDFSVVKDRIRVNAHHWVYLKIGVLERRFAFSGAGQVVPDGRPILTGTLRDSPTIKTLDAGRNRRVPFGKAYVFSLFSLLMGQLPRDWYHVEASQCPTYIWWRHIGSPRGSVIMASVGSSRHSAFSQVRRQKSPYARSGVRKHYARNRPASSIQ